MTLSEFPISWANPAAMPPSVASRSARRTSRVFWRPAASSSAMSRWFSARRSSSRADMWLKARTRSASSLSSGQLEPDAPLLGERLRGRGEPHQRARHLADEDRGEDVAEHDPEERDDARAPGELAGAPDDLLVRELDEHRPDHRPLAQHRRGGEDPLGVEEPRERLDRRSTAPELRRRRPSRARSA